MLELPLSSVDIFFMSYDEPNAEKHWADLLDKVPWAKRVHGVKGFDQAHRECARQSETDWFITVDADNIVDPSFLELTITVDPVKDRRKSFCWNGINEINGLMYGNGGLKLWSKEYAIEMASHELGEGVDFCWDAEYLSVKESYSSVYNNGSPYQAFRVGFREGVKLAMDRGRIVKPIKMLSELHEINLRNLRIWCSVGGDVENGIYAVLGANMGLNNVCDPDFDHTNINDFEWFDNLWKTVSNGGNMSEQEAAELAKKLSVDNTNKTNIEISILDKTTSAFFRETFKLRNI